jgi:Lon protease-like protein
MLPGRVPDRMRGKVIRHEPFPDGRSDLVVRGCHAVDIEEWLASEPYPKARVKVREQGDCFAAAPGAKDVFKSSTISSSSRVRAR